MSDAKLRELERRIASGDPSALPEYLHLLERVRGRHLTELEQAIVEPTHPRDRLAAKVWMLTRAVAPFPEPPNLSHPHLYGIGSDDLDNIHTQAESRTHYLELLYCRKVLQLGHLDPKLAVKGMVGIVDMAIGELNRGGHRLPRVKKQVKEWIAENLYAAYIADLHQGAFDDYLLQLARGEVRGFKKWT